MPNTTLKRKRNTAPSPAFSIASSNTSNSSISEISNSLLDDSKNKPIATDLRTMRNVVSQLKPGDIKKIKDKLSKTGGKKYKRKTMKNKKSRKPTKK
jgi:hypothetical protein